MVGGQQSAKLSTQFEFERFTSTTDQKSELGKQIPASGPIDETILLMILLARLKASELFSDIGVFKI